mgnify:CR=1 FL=1
MLFDDLGFDMKLQAYPQYNSAADLENVVCYLADLNRYVDAKSDN